MRRLDPVELPDGWRQATLGEAARLVKDKVVPSEVPDAAYVGLEHVEAQTMRLVGTGRGADVKSAKTRFLAGDVLYGKLRPYLNKVARPTFDGICSTDFLVFSESDDLDAGYLAYYLNQSTVAAYANHVSSGVQLPRVGWKSLAELSIPYPESKVEQRAIVDQIERVRESYGSALGHVSVASGAVDRFRDAILASACSGRLTAELRPAESAVASVAQLDDDHTALPVLPPGWTYAPLDALRDPRVPIAYGIVLPGPQVVDGVPYVRQQDIVGGTVLTEALGRTAPEIARKHGRSALLEGDVLLGIIRNLRVAIVPAGLDGANITQGMVRIRPGDKVLGRYLAAYLESPYAQRWMHDRYVGLAMPRINVADARAIPIAVAPLEEQHEIVERLDALLGSAQAVGDHVGASAARLNSTFQAVLQKAFSGGLTSSVAVG